MNEGKFKTFLMVAESIGGDYNRGYQRGLRRHFHGEQFGTESERNQYMNLDGHRAEIGEGYRDGFNGNAPRGFHANIGNANAQKYKLPLDSNLKCRINSQIKSACVKKAKSEGMKLSEWVIKTLIENIK